MSMKISEIAEGQRPYERLAQSGVEALRDSELIAILLQSGTAGQSSTELAEALLFREGEGELAHLAQYTVQQFQKQRGVGLAKAARLVAAFELGRRCRTRARDYRPLFNSSEKIYEYFRGEWAHKENEQALAIFLDVRLRLIRSCCFGEGLLSRTCFSLRELCRKALQANAHAVVLLHNHPSGDPTPSVEDIESTRRVARALSELGLRLLDHLVIAADGFRSLGDASQFILSGEEERTAAVPGEEERRALHRLKEETERRLRRAEDAAGSTLSAPAFCSAFSPEKAEQKEQENDEKAS